MAYKPSNTVQVLQAIIGIVLLIVLFGLFWLVVLLPIFNVSYYRSIHPIEFKITDVSISQFNLTSNNTLNNTLYYNFKVTITAKNFAKDKRSLEGKINVISSYKGHRLPRVTMGEHVVVGGNNTIMLQPIVFAGNITIKLKPQQLIEYNKETQLGIYNLGLKLSQHDSYDRHNMHCQSLRIPLISDDKQAPTFNATTCRWYIYDNLKI